LEPRTNYKMIKCRDIVGYFELIEACDQYDLGRIQKLLDYGTDPNLQNKCGQTALMTASYNGHTNVVRLLLDHGADPNLQDYWLQTAIMHASRRGPIDMVRLLLDHGADPNLRSVGGWTALNQASYRGHIDIVNVIWDLVILKPLTNLSIFPEGLIREHLSV
jgi:ankyrin repeat protein